MRLIDADALTIAVHEDWDECLVWDRDGTETANEIERTIWEQPTVDAVVVVHCKDCVHCSENGGEDCPVEKHHPIQMYGFCHFGERRSE